MKNTSYKYSILLCACIYLISCAYIGIDNKPISCRSDEIDCYRFNYDSLGKFKESVDAYSIKWGLPSPTFALTKINTYKSIDILNSEEGVALIESNPSLIFSLGQYLEKHKKPREWMFLSEQAFIRSWNSLNR
ncbi:MAG: hypothetical protein VCA13_01880 [PS1 clade bacterium]|jgi:hypothetical protein